MFDKTAMVKKLIDSLQTMLDRATRDKNFAQQEANSHVGAMASRYDTFKEESQYLAVAQQKRIFEIQSSLNAMKEYLHALETMDAGNREEVGVGSLVFLEGAQGEEKVVFIVPAGGGEVVQLEDRVISVVSIRSPLGMNLLQKNQYDSVSIPTGKGRTEFEIVRIE